MKFASMAAYPSLSSRPSALKSWTEAGQFSPAETYPIHFRRFDRQVTAENLHPFKGKGPGGMRTGGKGQGQAGLEQQQKREVVQLGIDPPGGMRADVGDFPE